MHPVWTFSRRYLTPYLPWYAAGTLALLATNALSVTIPLYIGGAIDALRAGEPREVVLWHAGAVGLMGLVIMGVRSLSRIAYFTPGRLVEARVKRDLFERVLRQQPAFLRQFPTGDLVSRASSDVNYLRLFAGFGVLQLVNSVIALSLTLTQMVRISPVLAAWTLLPLGLGMIFVQLFIRRVFALLKRMQEELAALSDHVLSSYQGIATVHAFNAEPAFLGRFEQHNRAYLRTSLLRSQMRAAIQPTLSLAAALDVFVLLFVGGPLAIRGEITVGDLVAFTTLVAYFTGPLRGVGFLLNVVKQAQAAIERVDAVLAPPPERPDLPLPLPAPDHPPALEVRGLTFGYPGEPPVLHDVSFAVPAGGTLGIIGPTGSGKSTLVRCLTRLFNPPAGTVLVDGADVRAIDLDGWRRAVSLVPQRAFLFSESVAENILLGRDDPELLGRVLALAALDVDVATLPHGLETQVGEKGVTLSGGQRQRAALARGLARPHGVLILDDVLSAVDHATEQQLIASIRADRCTTIVVSNRISALHHADRILVLDGGRVVDAGTHAELASRPGFYRETWERQAEGEP